MKKFSIPDEYKKYSTLLGGILIHISLASSHTFGNMTPYLISYLRMKVGLDVRYSQGIWIFTFLGVGMSISAVLGGMLATRFNLSLKLIVFFACLTICGTHFLTYFAISYSFYLVVVTFGFLYGIGGGIAYVTPLSIVMKWFPHNQGLANAGVLFGSGFGGIVFTQIQTLYINPENYSPDFPYSPEFPDEKYFSLKYADLLDRVPYCFLLLGGIFFIIEMIGLLLMFEKKDEELPVGIMNALSLEITDCDSIVDDDKQEIISADLVDKETKEKQKLNKQAKNSLGIMYLNDAEGLSLKKTLREPSLYLIAIMFNLSILAPDLFSADFKTFGQTFIQDDKFLALIGSICNVFSSVGRFFWGYIADKLSFKISFLIANTCIMSLLFTVYLNVYIENKFVYMLWVCLILFSLCGVYVVIPTGLARTFGQKNFTSIYGVIIFLGLPTNFIQSAISPISDSLGWFALICISCSFSVIAWIAAVFFRVKNEKNRDI